MKIKTKEQAKELGLDTWLYENGDWEYEDLDGYYHLIRNSEELLPNVKKKYTVSYSNGEWEYEDTDGYYHLFRDGKELLPDVKKKDIYLYSNGNWEYQDEDDEWHKVKGDNKEVVINGK